VVPLFELEEGPHHKFYRIERIGTRLELHWGRIGTAGQKKTLELGDERQAEREYDLEVGRRRERGYRLVVDESQPHDAAEAQQRVLAATGALTKYPRFVFRKRAEVTWLEVRGTILVTASGTTGKIPMPVERDCGSERAALRERDRMMTELVGRGYQLDEFGAAETPAAKRRLTRPGGLKSHPELEAQLAASPDDAGTWLVYEDWMLEQQDPRAVLIALERSGDASAAAQARGAIKKLLLGPRAATFESQISGATWRTGYVRSCRFDATGARGSKRLVAFLDSVAARYLTELDVQLADFDRLADVQGARLLRSLRASPEFAGEHVVRTELLEPLESLESLALDSLVHLEPAPCLARLRSLALTYADDTELGELADAPLANLTELLLYTSRGALRHSRGELAAAMPRLRDLVVAVETARAEQALELVLASKLVPQLRTLAIQDYTPTRVLAAERAKFRGGVFAHLERVELPATITR
jgi:uncharacterized protein (TIGR02996 family)